jgi:hypothetical protein
MNFKNWKGGKVFTSKSVETGPSSYGKRIYRAAVSQRLRNTDTRNVDNVAAVTISVHQLHEEMEIVC